jgi:hypothetical protein
MINTMPMRAKMIQTCQLVERVLYSITSNSCLNIPNESLMRTNTEGNGFQ